jgi:hypothetical protein
MPLGWCVGVAPGRSAYSSDDICRVGQNPIYTLYIRYFWQENYLTYSLIRCIYRILANPRYLISMRDVRRVCNVQKTERDRRPGQQAAMHWDGV